MQNISPIQLIYTVLRLFGSLAIAVFLLSVLVIVLAITTFIEAAYNADVVTFFVYNTLWFHGLLFFLCLNVLCSMLSRFPWKGKHLPFLTAHLGILVLLGGCYVTSRWGREANISLFEGKSSRYALAKGYNFLLTPLSEETELEKPVSSPHSFGINPEELAQRREEERKRQVAVPFDGGPFNWNDYKRANWFGDPARPFSHVLWGLMHLVPHGSEFFFSSDAEQSAKLGTKVYLQVLDYIGNGRKIPAAPLELTVKWGEDGSNDGGKAESVQLVLKPEIGIYQGSQVELGLGAGYSSVKGQLTFRVAKNHQVEVGAFLQATLSESDFHTPSSEEQAGQSLGVVQIYLLGGKTYVVSVEELLKKQMENRIQLDELQREMRELNRKRLSLSQNRNNSEDGNGDDGELQNVEKEVLALSEKILQLQQQGMIPLGDSGYRIGLAKFMPDGPAIIQQSIQQGQNMVPTGPMLHLTVSGPDRQNGQLVLFSDRPDLNTQADSLGLFGTYWVNPQLVSEKATGIIAPTILERLKQPRLDLLQSPSGQLFYRYSIGQANIVSGEVPPNRQLSLASGTDSLSVDIVKFTPHDMPGYNIVPIPFEKDQKKYVPEQFVKLRVIHDEYILEEFWIRSQYLTQIPFLDEPDEDQVKILPGIPGKGSIRLVFQSKELDLGFALYLKKYSHKMEPGSRIPAQFSSLVDMRKPDETADRIDLVSPERPGMRPERKRQDIVPLQENVLIKMNQPGVFTDQLTGRPYRVYQSSWAGPFGPQTMEFQYLFDKELFPGETEPRESIYKSVLSVNYDPGRGLKYLGSAMLVFGTAWLIFRSTRKTEEKKAAS